MNHRPKFVFLAAGALVVLSLCWGCNGGGGTGPDPAECEELLPFPESIESSMTLPKGCYLVKDVVILNSELTLTLAPGVQLFFAQDARMEISDKAALHAVGTADDPIYFTGEQKSRGFWGGVGFTNANSVENAFDYVTVEYGGGYDWTDGIKGNVVLLSSGYPVRLSVSNSTIQESAGWGFYLRDESVLPTFSGNTVTKNALGAGLVHSESAHNLSDTSTYVGNDKDVVMVEGDSVVEEATWQAIDVDYLVHDDVLIHAPLTIAAGATLVFTQDSGLQVESDGALTAVGTSDKPILFTGEQQQRGYWDGIGFTNADSTENKLDYVTVEYGGGYDWTNGIQANVALLSSGYPVRLSASNTIIQESGGWGFYLRDESVLPTFSGNTVTKNTLGAGLVHSESAHNLSDESTYVGNDKDVVMVEGNAVEVQATWQAIDVDYLMHDDVIIHAPLTIAAGATLVFTQDSGLQVESDGSLTAVGTSANPIIFTGEQQQNGYWDGIVFSNSNHVENKFEYVTVEYGGGYEFRIGLKANIALDSSGYPVSLDMTNSTIQHSGDIGLWLDQDATTNADVQTANTWADNSGGDIVYE